VCLEKRLGEGQVQKPCSGGGCDVVVWAASVAMCREIILCWRAWRRLALRQPRGRRASGVAFIVWV
jgi:hypothetical protein